MPDTKVKFYEELVLRISKLLAAIVLIASLSGTFLIETVGPGLWKFFGLEGLENRLIENISKEIETFKAEYAQTQNEIIADIEIILASIDAPKVVIWHLDETFILGNKCTYDLCTIIFSAQRTEYGLSCGTPQVPGTYPEIRSKKNGRVTTISFHEDWRPVTLSDQKRAFPVRFAGLEGYSEGEYEIRITILYPSCTGRNEPIPRHTPWIPVILEKDV